MTAGTLNKKLAAERLLVSTGPGETAPDKRSSRDDLEDDTEAGNLDIGLDGLIQAADDTESDDARADSDTDSSDLDIGEEIGSVTGGEGDEEGPEHLDLADLLSPIDPLATADDDAEGPDEEVSLGAPAALGEVDDDGAGPSEATDEPLDPLLPMEPMDALGSDESAEGPLGEGADWPDSERVDAPDPDEDDALDAADEPDASDESDESDESDALDPVTVFLSFRPPVPERLWEQVCVIDIPDTTECMLRGRRGLVVAGAGIEIVHPHRETLPAPPGYVTRLIRGLCIASNRVFHMGSDNDWHEVELPTEQPPLELWARGGTWLVLCADGALFRSVDRGKTWTKPLAEGLRCLGRGDPLMALSAPPSNRLLRSVDDGLTWKPPATGRDADAAQAVSRAYSTAAAPQLDVSGGLVLLAEPSAGIGASADGGVSLDPLDGTFEVSAATCTEIQGTPTAFAAVPSSRSVGSDIVQIGPTAELQECIGHVGPIPNGDDDRVRALDFDPGTELLWALMDARVVAWRPRTN